MSLQIGIVGLPNVGKSTLFNALLKKQQALAANYPFATIEPNIGIVPVPDQRLQQLAETIASERLHTDGASPGNKESLTYTKLPPIVPATVEFVDIAGLVKGASQGEGLGNKFLSHIREVDAIGLVLRVFDDSEVVDTGSGDLREDFKTLLLELILADIDTIQKQREPKGKVGRAELARWEVVRKFNAVLIEGKPASEAALSDEELLVANELQLLTRKPILYVVNTGEAELLHMQESLAHYASQLGVDAGRVIIISAKVEADLAELSETDQKAYLHELELESSGLERLIGQAYETLGLISFLTAGEKEVRAWTIRKGQTAQEAAGVIHTDFFDKFIKAEVINWQDFVACGGWKQARDKGLVRQEGREYRISDGEVVLFRTGT
jgi:ribosome-binding ATPase